MSGTKATNRIDYIDIAKGIGMIMVVLGHAYHTPMVLNRIVFSVHMPLFFILSGFFFSFKPEEKIGTFIKKNAKSLLLPYALTSLMVIVLQTVIDIKNHEGGTRILKWILGAIYGSGARIPVYMEDSVYSIGVIWFLLALFIGKVILRLILKSRVPLMWALVLFFISYVSRPWFWLPFSIQPGLCCVLFLYIGYVIRKHEMFEFKAVHFSIRILMAAVWGYCIVNCGILWMVENYYENNILDIIGAICGTYTIVYISQLIEKFVGFLEKPLAFLGRNSLGVMCAHLIALNCWPRGVVVDFFTDKIGWPGWIGDFINVGIMTGVVALVIYFVPWFNKIMFPSRLSGKKVIEKKVS